MSLRKEVIPHLLVVWAILSGTGMILVIAGISRPMVVIITGALIVALSLYLLWFFRDPERTGPESKALIVSAADGKVTGIERFSPGEFKDICLRSGLLPSVFDRMSEFTGHPVVRISVFLSLTDVHVNRSPMSGTAEFLGYFPGKHLLTIREKSSEVNQHNAIRIFNHSTGCLMFQIVGPVARRVVYWPDKTKPVSIQRDERIGMMKFGSRLDLYFPEADILLMIKPGDRVTAGITPIAKLNTYSA